MRRKLIIEKQSTCATTTEYPDTNNEDYDSDSGTNDSDSGTNDSGTNDSDSGTNDSGTNDSDSGTNDSDSGTFTETFTSQQDGGAFKSFTKSKYKKPKGGSVQDNFTVDEIRSKLKNCIPLKTINDKKILENLPVYKTWIKYINIKSKKYRTGGLLVKTSYPDYIMLANPQQKLIWSVQLQDNIIYIKDPRLNKTKTPDKETLIKNKLYEMYKDGRLAVK